MTPPDKQTNSISQKIFVNILRIFFIIIFIIIILFFIYFFRFCVVIRFFHPRHNGQWPPTSKDFLSQILSIAFIFLS